MPEQEGRTTQTSTQSSQNEITNESSLNCTSIMHQPCVQLWTARVHINDSNTK